MIDNPELAAKVDRRHNQAQGEGKNRIRGMWRNRFARFGTKKLTILHSNDIHGDFDPIRENGREAGGLTLLSGYVQNCRKERDNVLYVIAGDMFRGSILDADSDGLATVYLINAMMPDVVALGNHEVDYGIEHLLFLEKCADFPIINANMKVFVPIKEKRMFRPAILVRRNSMRILFIGLLTEETNRQVVMDPMVGEYIRVTDPAEELKSLFESKQLPKADITVLLTHIGLNEDIALAKNLDPAWGIDLIIGGHSHDLTEEPVVENGVTIVQTGIGSGRIGRFDLEYDFTSGRITSCQWQCLPVNSDTCPKDTLIEECIALGMEKVGKNNRQEITTLRRELTHPNRREETELGDLYADSYKSRVQASLALIGSTSIRTDRLGTRVTLGDFKENFPYTDDGYLLKMTGEELKRGFLHILDELHEYESSGRMYQVSEGTRIDYDYANRTLLRFDLNGQPLQDRQVCAVAVEGYLYNNMRDLFGFSADELTYGEQAEKLPSVQELILDYLKTNPGLEKEGKGRINIL